MFGLGSYCWCRRVGLDLNDVLMTSEEVGGVLEDSDADRLEYEGCKENALSTNCHLLFLNYQQTINN